MNNIETNALRIAELMGIKTHISIIGAFGTVIDKIPNTGVINKFMEYNGLMPIVFECNSGEDYRIQIFTNYKELCVQFLNRNIMTIDREELFGYTTEPEFIEAIQLAVIKYLELKNEH